ncbi:MAG: hypothetical protein EXR50_02160 [Dehalococcoidia bacterium]|nr:hypothetical protein [Dehalococcoidia bacterium]
MPRGKLVTDPPPLVPWSLAMLTVRVNGPEGPGVAVGVAVAVGVGVAVAVGVGVTVAVGVGVGVGVRPHITPARAGASNQKDCPQFTGVPLPCTLGRTLQ